MKSLQKRYSETVKRQFRGCLLAGGCGDALGLSAEFLTLDEIRKQYGPKGVTNMEEGRYAGAISDDTQMTMFVAEGLLMACRERLDVCDEVESELLEWYKTQKPGAKPPKGSDELLHDTRLYSRRAPGDTNLASLKARAPGKTPQNESKGCGAVMRSAPFGLLPMGDAWGHARRCAELTHGHQASSDSAGLLAEIIELIVDGMTIKRAVLRTWRRRRSQCHPDVQVAVDRALSASRVQKPPSAEIVESLGQGWVAEEALAIAIYCSMKAKNVRQGILLAVNHGGDSDSTGAITGNILGASRGEAAIPRAWLEVLELRDVLTELADKLAECREECP